MGKVIHLDNVSGGGGATQYKGTFTNWTALTTAYPTATFGDYAIVEDAEGTAWLPWTLGGTYYPQGTYYFDGVKWDSNVELIAEELQNINDRIDSIFGEESIYLKSYSLDTSDYLNATDKKIIWDGSFFGNKITHSSTVDNTKFFIQEAGNYNISCNFTWIGDANNERENLGAKIFINGVALTEQYFSYERDSAGSNRATIVVVSLAQLSVNDYVEIGITEYGATTGTVLPISNASVFNIQKLAGLTTTANDVVLIEDVIKIAFADSPYIASWGQDIEADSTLGDITINMPSSVGSNGKTIKVTKIDSTVNTLTVDGNGSETINDDSTDVIQYQWTSNTYKSNGLNSTKR